QTGYRLEDLGPFTLAEKIELWNGSQDKEKIRSAYMEVLKNLVIMQFQLPELLKGLLSKNPMNYAAFQGDVAYFRRNYLDCFGFGKEFSHQVEAEITDNLIGPLSRLEDKYFIYRDFQSRNIMWLEDKPWFIDYQSAMKGSLYYDPASLFFASKAGLDDEMIDELLLGYYHLLESPVTFEEFNRNFYLFVLLRRLRSLGSYGYLSQVKGKSQFYAAILPTLDQLAKILNQGFFESDFYHLLLMVKRLGELWKEKSAG
ncbi:MAG: phosphotransferase, partial [Deltaproteobacteria bacterium]|nr:phosphotransferase [Deltaproteobacteria bacterium]